MRFLTLFDACSKMNDVFFVYIDWTLEESPRVFYVGKGKLKRVNTHAHNARWKEIASQYGYRREIILGTKHESYAFEQEIRFIASYGTFENSESGRWGANKHPGGKGSACINEGEMNAARRPSVRERIRQTLLTNKPLVGLLKPLSTLEQRSKITRIQAEEIRILFEVRGVTRHDLAVEYHLSEIQIGSIIAKRKWKQALDPLIVEEIVNRVMLQELPTRTSRYSLEEIEVFRAYGQLGGSVK